MPTKEPPIYVVVCSNDGDYVLNDDGPFVMETYTKTATLARALEQAGQMERNTRYRYGPCRVARRRRLSRPLPAICPRGRPGADDDATCHRSRRPHPDARP